MGSSVYPAAATSVPDTLPVTVPSGLTLRYTYTSSQTGLSFPVNQVYAVVIGGGGAAGTAGSSNGISGIAGASGRIDLEYWV